MNPSVGTPPTDDENISRQGQGSADECLLTGICALELAEALGRRLLEFRQEQAKTIALIARLPVYQPHAHTLFIHAVSSCEEVVANNASPSNQYKLLSVLQTASYSAPDDLGAQ